MRVLTVINVEGTHDYDVHSRTWNTKTEIDAIFTYRNLNFPISYHIWIDKTGKSRNITINI